MWYFLACVVSWRTGDEAKEFVAACDGRGAAVCEGVCVAAEQYPVIYEHDVKVAMRDGVMLRADIYRPRAEGKFPVLLNRTPYDKVNVGVRPASGVADTL